MRFYIRVHHFAPVLTLSGDMGWDLPINRRTINILRYWNRLMKMDIDRIPKQLFLAEYNNNMNGWCHNVEAILEQIGTSSVFENLEYCNLEIGKLRLYNITEADFLDEIDKKPKLRTYKLIKDNIRCENYLKYYLPKNKRSIMAQFRIRILPLEIETGRFCLKIDTDSDRMRKLNINERNCEMCNKDELEDEVHFLCRCSKYDELRKKLFSADLKFLYINVRDLDDLDKLRFLVTSCWKPTANYLHDAFMKRRDCLIKSV
jgi:hypothetical protein